MSRTQTFDGFGAREIQCRGTINGSVGVTIWSDSKVMDIILDKRTAGLFSKALWAIAGDELSEAQVKSLAAGCLGLPREGNQ